MTRRIALGVLVASALATAASAASLSQMERLGKQLFFDDLSSPATMSCATCHGTSVGFTGPDSDINRLLGGIYPGAVPERYGNRKPPTAAYATFSPVLHIDKKTGEFVGGAFWDGRATGEHLGSPVADQALGPFLNPLEHNEPTELAVLEAIAASPYAWRWARVWGEPISFDTPEDIRRNYNRIGVSIAAYEASFEINQFSSKFDAFWKNVVEAGMDPAAINVENWHQYDQLGLTDNELRGFALFNDAGKGKCSACHVLDSAMDPDGNVLPPLFTDFTYDNVGAPKNPVNPFYNMDEVYLDDGSPINPLGDEWIDTGLGGFLETHSNPVWSELADENYGKHKVPTLRNVAKKPGPEFIKSFLHNGYFTSLREVVHFYNTRDIGDWPAAEIPENVNTDEMGNLGLSKEQEALIVLFLETLSDGFRVSDDIDTMITTARVLPAPVLTPNPLGALTTIAYSVPASGRVQVRVFDVAGRQVATVVDGVKAAGRYDVRFMTDRLPSGVYFVRLETAGKASTTRAVLIH